jgi:hypothetical protein
MYPVINTGGAAIIISTVNGIGNWYQETYYAAESGDNEFNIIEMDYWEHPDYVTPSWVRMTWANLGDKGWAQEILRSFLGSGETYIPATIIAQIGEFAKRSKPLRVLFKEWSNPSEKKMGWDQGGLWIWKQPIDGHEYIASCDCAEGVGNDGDNSCIEILDIGTLEQVAEFYSNSVPPHVFSQIAYQIGTYYNTALLVVETNGVGAAVGKALHQSLSYDNLYFDGTKKTTSSSPGIKATPQNRPVYLESFQHRVVNGTLRIFSRRVVKELETFMYNPATHRAEAQKRKHDDAILALSLALYVRDTYMTDIPVGAEVPEELTQIFNTDMFKKIQEEIIGEERSLWMKEEMPSIIMLPYVNDDETREDMIRLRRPHDLLLREFGW